MNAVRRDPDPSQNKGVSLLIVSHSATIAKGLTELLAEVAGPTVSVLAVGGMSDGALGTDGLRVLDALRSTAHGAGGVALMDMGSTVLAVRAALAELTPAERSRVIVADAPLVEGAIAAAVSASLLCSLEEVARAAESARVVPKF